MSIDANFHLIGLNKRNNEHEDALWGGLGYIRNQRELEEHVRLHQHRLHEEVKLFFTLT